MNILKGLKEKLKQYEEPQQRNKNQFKNNQIKILRPKDRISEMKISPEGFKRRLRTVKEMIVRLKYIAVKTGQIGTDRRKKA